MNQAQQFEEFKNLNKVVNDEIIYHFDQVELNNQLDDHPWTSDPNYFKTCKVSVNALIKMLIHSCLGKNNEVMGVVQGGFKTDTFIIYDIIQIHAQASETTVVLSKKSIQITLTAPQAMADLTLTTDYLETVGRQQQIVGQQIRWYHSHPNYGCWLSGTDVATQELQQQGYGAFVAIVIDPIRSLTKSKVEIGAFRVYPQNYNSDKEQQLDQLIPSEKTKEFGAYHNRYYSLKVEFFCNSIDKDILQNLWGSYWGVRLAQGSLWENQVLKNIIMICKSFFTDGLQELKCKCYRNKLQPKEQNQIQGGQQETPVDQFTKEAAHFSIEYAQAILSENLKRSLFQ